MHIKRLTAAAISAACLCMLGIMPAPQALAHPGQHGLVLASQRATTASASASPDDNAEISPASANAVRPANAANDDDAQTGKGRSDRNSREASAKSQISAQKPKSPWAFPVPDPAVPDGPTKLIVIDPGHGGTNEGAIGVAGIHEKHLTLQVALLLADRLRRDMPEAEIVLTRDRDEYLSLADRIERANALGADLFLSLHFNSSQNPDAVGFESFWAGDYWRADMEKAGAEITPETERERARQGALGYRFAEAFNRAMRHRFDVLDRGVKPGDFTVLTRAKVPAAVLEMAFLSHAAEGMSAVKPNHIAKLADAVAEAVKRYQPAPEALKTE